MPTSTATDKQPQLAKMYCSVRGLISAHMPESLQKLGSSRYSVSCKRACSRRRSQDLMNLRCVPMPDWTAARGDQETVRYCYKAGASQEVCVFLFTFCTSRFQLARDEAARTRLASGVTSVCKQRRQKYTSC